MKSLGVCGSPISVESSVLARIPPVLGEPCRIVRELLSPPRRLYVRVSTHRISVDDYIELARRHGIHLQRDEEVPCAVWTRVEGPFRPNRYPGRVVVDKRAAESVLMGSDLYAPGVIEASGFSKGDMVSVYSVNGVHVGSGRAVMDPHVMVRSRKGLAVRITEPVYRSVRVHDLPGYAEGLVYGQSISSMYVGHIIEPRDGDVIVDMTASPGGKISHVAQKAKKRGVNAKIIAVDRPSKIPKLRETINRLGLEDIIQVVGGDSRRITRIMPELEGKATKVILDPPCSNLGVRPKVYDHKTSKDIANLAAYQRSFMDEAYKLLVSGGTLYYSTCTLTADENQSNRAYAIDYLSMEPAEVFDYRRPRRGDRGELLFSPLDGIPGFYISVLRKTR
jgi:16S rRNA (cytosine967-C5)-methyltransferase